MNAYKKSREGLTIIEALFAIAASAMLILIVSLILIMTYHIWHTNNAYADLRRDVAFASSIITREVRESSFNGLNDGSSLSALNAASGETSVFLQSGDSLNYTSSTNAFALIPRGVTLFSTSKLDDGVEVTIAVANPTFAISITNQIFINTRN